jgi:CubicO group peptidase (beta-lactamase class C family)
VLRKAGKEETMHPKFPSDEFQAFVEQTLELWHVPGAAVAVVHEGRPILCQGYGLRDVARGLPATADTLFPIASCTKAFTALCVGLLVDEGKLEWDKPVRGHMPTFKLHDDVATNAMTARDLLCHRSGLPRHDLLWYGASFSRRQVFDRLRYVESSYGFRSTWQYQNMMYMVAGLLVEEISGLSWEAFLRQRVLDVLDMARTNTSTAVAQADPDHARPYLYRKGELKEIPYYECDEHEATGPAGTVNSCVREMVPWLMVHTTGGKAGQTQLISPHNLAEMHKPHVFIDDAQARDRLGYEFYSYGLGWFLHSHKGQVVVSHGGNLDGFSSLVSFLPRHNLGVVVLSNGDGLHNSVPGVLINTLYDRLLDLDATDWNAKAKALSDELIEAMELSHAQSDEEKRPAPPSHPIEDYLGEYEHPGYGVYAVRREGDALQLVTNDKLVLPLVHHHYDIFEATLEAFEMRVKASFTTDLKGNIAGFWAQMEPMVKEIFFRRLPDRRLTDPAWLAQFTGEYDLLEKVLAVELKEGKLHASLPDHAYELEPYRGNEFALKGHPGFSIAFQADEAGAITQAVVSQPEATYVARRK